MAGLIDPSKYVVASARHENVPTPGEGHDVADCPGPDGCAVAAGWKRLRDRILRDRP